MKVVFNINTVSVLVWSPQTAVDLKPMMDAFAEYFEQNNYAGADMLLSAVDFDNCNRLGISAIMRATFSARTKLPSWNKRLLDAAEALDKIGVDSKHALRGLY